MLYYILVAFLLVAFLSGAPLFTIMLAGASLGAFALSGAQRPFDAEFDGMIASLYSIGTGEHAQTLSTLPLFVYAGYLLSEANSGDRLVRFGNAALGWMPGGLAVVAIVASAIYTIFTGGSGVTIIALGGVLLPGLVKQGYPEKFGLGLVAGTGAVGLLLPPAVPLFIFGTIYGLTRLEPEYWDTRRFLFAGVVPGLVVIGMLSIFAIIVAVRRKLPRATFSGRELVESFLDAFPELLIPGLVIGGLALGFGLPDVAAFTVAYVIILEVLTKRIAPKQLWTVSREAFAMVGAIFIIIYASTVMTNYLTTAKVPQALVEWTQAHVGSKWVFLLALNLMLLVVGTIMDVFSAIVIIVPLIAPIAKAYGVDPYHLGIIFLLNLEVGYLHPPVGLNLFITSVKFQKPVTEVMWATMPFLGVMLLSLVIITYVPALTVVPEAERTVKAERLGQIVHEGVESVRSVKSLNLITASGEPVLDSKGQPLVRTLAQCDGIANENNRDSCKQVFFEVSDCRNGKGVTPELTASQCEAKAIASWIENNKDELDLALAAELPLVDAEGQPVNDAAGAPRIHKLASCAGKTGMELGTCREVFINVALCRINPPEGQSLEECTRDKVSTWVLDNTEEPVE